MSVRMGSSKHEFSVHICSHRSVVIKDVEFKITIVSANLELSFVVSRDVELKNDLSLQIWNHRLVVSKDAWSSKFEFSVHI